MIVGYYVTCDDALCSEHYHMVPETEETLNEDEALAQWKELGGFEDWPEPIAIEDEYSFASDTPTHCIVCSQKSEYSIKEGNGRIDSLIDHPLTAEGMNYVFEEVLACLERGHFNPVSVEWYEAYDMEEFIGEVWQYVLGSLPVIDYSATDHPIVVE